MLKLTMATPRTRPVTTACPVCKELIAYDKLTSHYELEVRRLQSSQSTPSSDLTPENDVYNSLNNKSASRQKRGAAVDARRKLSAQVTRTDHDRQILNKVRRGRLDRARLQEYVPDSTGSKVRLRCGTPRNPLTLRLDHTDFAGSDGATYNNGPRPKCPICLVHLDGDDADVNWHIDGCLETKVQVL